MIVNETTSSIKTILLKIECFKKLSFLKTNFFAKRLLRFRFSKKMKTLTSLPPCLKGIIFDDFYNHSALFFLLKSINMFSFDLRSSIVSPIDAGGDDTGCPNKHGNSVTNLISSL